MKKERLGETMNKRDKQNIKITDLKDMLIKTEKIYASNPAYIHNFFPIIISTKAKKKGKGAFL